MSTAYEEYQQMCAELEFLRNQNFALQAHINTLREALEEMVDTFKYMQTAFNDCVFDKANEALSATAKQSLIEHDNEIISKCAYICDNWKCYDVIDECCDTAQNIALLAVSDAIRALIKRNAEGVE